MRFVLAAAGLALMVNACSEAAIEPPAPAEAPAPAVLGGVDLNAPVWVVGTEPFWAVNITPDVLVYSAPEVRPVTIMNSGPVVQGTTAVFSGASQDGTALAVTLIATECSDGMSDRTYPLTARVELGGETFNGCANSVAARDSEPSP